MDILEGLELSEQLQNKTDALADNFIKLWKEMKEKRKNREISYEEYIEWKLTFEMREGE